MQKKAVRRLSPLATIVLLLFLAAAITGIVILLQPGSLMQSLAALRKTPSLIVLNGLPALALITALYFLTGNVFAAGAVTALVMELLSYANRLKIEGRNDPLVPADVGLLRESLTAVGDYHLNLHPGLIALIAASVLLLILAAIRWRSAKPRAALRAGGFLGVAAVFGVCLMTVYSSSAYYTALPDVDKSNVPLVFNTYGFPYCFLHNVNRYPVDKPQGYRAADVEQWMQEYLPADEPMDANVILVMGEAFTDLSDEAVFGYSAEDNPIAAYHALADSDRAISGHMTVQGFGAGTANTEFDVLTGMQTETLSSHTTSAFRVVRHGLDSLARIYTADGYHAWLMHPGQGWFYNRSSVYPFLGIDEHVFIDSFTNADRNGDYVSDAAFGEKLKAEIAEADANGDSCFVYSVSIENHQAYVYRKYDHTFDSTLPEGLSLSDAAREQMDVYFYGARHTAEMIADLAAYLDTLEKPTLLVFFGDHRPALGEDYLAYREIGSEAGQTDTPEQTVYTYETPYMIWVNAAYAQQKDLQAEEAALLLPPGNLISDIYLGSLIYELTGRTGTDSYFDALITARRTLPVLCHGSYVLPDGSYTRELTPEQAAAAEKLHWWEYYRIKNGLRN